MNGTTRRKKVYSEKELEKVLNSKMTPDEQREVRLEKAENSIEVAFSAITELKAELNRLYSMVSEMQGLEEESTFSIKPKKVSRKKATEIIFDYISRNPGCRTSEILSDVQIDPEVVLDILRGLSTKGKIRNEKIAK